MSNVVRTQLTVGSFYIQVQTSGPWTLILEKTFVLKTPILIQYYSNVTTTRD